MLVVGKVPGRLSPISITLPGMSTGHRPPRTVSAVSTKRLKLRPLTAQDADNERIVRWHTDPEGYELMYEQPYPAVEAASRLRNWAAKWDSHGIGYWVAEQDGAPVGIGGVDALQHEGVDYLNLFYRLDRSARGHGLGQEIASATTAFAAEWLPGLPVVAPIAPRNAPSLRTARRAGLIDVGPWRGLHDPAGAVPSRLLQSPVSVVGPVQPGTPAYADLLDLWCAVIDTGGSVGFEPGAPRNAVAKTLGHHQENSTTTLIRLHTPTPDSFEDPASYGPLLGFGFVVGLQSMASHRCTLKRVMTSPDHRGTNLGRLLMGALHATARSDGYELAHISYRGGTGLEKFYEQCGYVETGRVPAGLRFSFGDRDDVDMTRRLDGCPLHV